MPNSKVHCESCGGTGYKSKNDGWVCPACKGDKVRPITIEDLREAFHRAWDKRPGIAITKEKEEYDAWLCTRYGIEERDETLMKRLSKTEELAREMRRIFDDSYSPVTYCGEEWIRQAMLRLARYVLKRERGG